eukprot:GHRR01025378.1.p2 GENE.GHRR01025378.1~~GHRR01025378.1.p2  ORF type:complete len:108 (+),score=13.91 GHRR01025378.1:368-691(+)
MGNPCIFGWHQTCPVLLAAHGSGCGVPRGARELLGLLVITTALDVDVNGYMLSQHTRQHQTVTATGYHTVHNILSTCWPVGCNPYLLPWWLPSWPLHHQQHCQHAIP